MSVSYFIVRLCQADSSFWDKTKPPDDAKPAQTPTDILQCDITPEHYIHHSLSSLCTPKNTHFKLPAVHSTHFPLPLVIVRVKCCNCNFFRSMFNSKHTMCCSTKYHIKQPNPEGDIVGRKCAYGKPLPLLCRSVQHQAGEENLSKYKDQREDGGDMIGRHLSICRTSKSRLQTPASLH